MPTPLKLKNIINSLKKTDVGLRVKDRVESFKALGKYGTDEEVFSELCFCILTANSRARVGIAAQRELGAASFLNMEEGRLSRKLRSLGCRFYNLKAKYIVNARKFYEIREILSDFSSVVEKRDWLARNILGMAYKESSHFLRNIGELDVAILDVHVLRILFKYGVFRSLERPKNRKEYITLEDEMRPLSLSLSMPMGELDLYLWYLETGEILK
jgi:N-glycosylase/DNA lyase